MIGVNPKQFFTLREGDIAYIVHRGSNSFGQYLLVTELKVGGMRRSIIILVGKAQQGWRAFGIELRRMLELSHYALGGPKALPYKSKLGSEIHPSQSFVETVKASVQVRKHLHQPSIRETEKIQVVENTTQPPRDKAGIQVVHVEAPAVIAKPIAVGGVEGSHCGINGDAKIKENIPEQNKFRLNNLNLKEDDSGREHQIRRASWLGKGLIVEVNEFGKRRVSWQRYRGDMQAGKWVAREDNFAQAVIKGRDNGPAEPHALWLGKVKGCSGPLLTSPFGFEAGTCSKQTQTKPSLGITGPIVDNGILESSSSGPSSISTGASTKVLPSSSVGDSLPLMATTMAPMVTLVLNSSLSAPEFLGGSGFSNQVSLRWHTQSPTWSILTAEEVQTACKLGSSPLVSICSSLEPAGMKVLSLGDPIDNSVEKLASSVVMRMRMRMRMRNCWVRR